MRHIHSGLSCRILSVAPRLTLGIYLDGVFVSVAYDTYLKAEEAAREVVADLVEQDAVEVPTC
jgi:hypothetical protein